MKKTYSYFIIRRYEKGHLLRAKFAFALLLAALVQFSAYGAPAKRHTLLYNSKGPSKNILPSRSSAKKADLSDIKVTGKITDASGLGLIGATIKIKNGASLGVTDVNGNFSIDSTHKHNHGQYISSLLLSMYPNIQFITCFYVVIDVYNGLNGELYSEL